MSPTKIRLQRVFREVFENEDLMLRDDLTQRNMAEWDSFAHVKLIIALEEEFGVKFTTDQVAQVGSVAAIQSIIESRTGSDA